MTPDKKISFLTTALLFVLIIFSTMNLMSCGDNNIPLISAITPGSVTISVSSHALLSDTGVTISGSNFGSSQGSQGQVYFDNVAVTTVASWADTTIVLSSTPIVPNASALTTSGTSYTANVYVSANGLASNMVSFVYNGT